MKYEAMITTPAGWMYFDTDCDSADSALQDFNKTCERIRLNIDNMRIQSIVIRRKSDEEEIDRKEFFFGISIQTQTNPQIPDPSMNINPQSVSIHNHLH